ncbi:MAG: peptidase S9 [Ignavibacterium sp.]|uniref:S9 family peptidase n=1 Tax=Ignavibacterium sp. TaxID=2651167 RepID=UPI0021DF404C|nr:S9 family peptidase [Ignavibacterium sp.]BDQ03661.1 MAG: peptidase S9 [Ignavibacterium sp.]GIV45544.1 MAG: peptidase S9 [Ignavibacterium sp.]
MIERIKPAIAYLIIILFASFANHSVAQKKQLTFNQVYMFGEPRLINQLPRNIVWFDDENYLQQKRIDGSTAIVKVNASTGKEEVLIKYSDYDDVLLEYELTLDDNILKTDDYKGFILKKDNDFYFFSLTTKELKRLTTDNQEKANPTLSPDGKKLAYTKNRDLYYVDIESGKETRITFDASETVYNGWASWVYYEEILGRSSNYRAFWWSPNSEMIAFLRTDDSPVPKFPLYKADGVHGELEWEHYPKSGDPNPNVKMGIAHLSDNKIIWVEEDETADQYTAWPFWTPDSKELFYQVLNRGQDHLQILAANPTTGKNRLVYEEKQSSFVEFFEDIHIFNDGSGFILRSDKDGYRHLYYYDMKGNLKSQLTKGDWTVTEINLVDEKNKKVYFEGNKDNSLDNHLFVVNLDGKGLTRLTKTSGTHDAKLSKQGSFFIDTYSSLNDPGKMELFNSKGESIRVLGERKSALMDEYQFGKAELFKIKTSDGIELPAMWVLPPDFDPTKKYPVLFSVYGGPGVKDVKNAFSSFLDRFFISQNGIIYFVVDHRGSEHFGKKGLAMMHRNLGKWEMNDYIEAVKYLRTLPFVDSTKIGITGGSYGGYVTCMALTYGADYFTHGIADFSVTDWHLYDNVYTERYMDKPEENPEGYKFGSALTHADKYKGYLLITHGTLDDNVHMQNTIQLVDKFTTLNKDFELMLYPNERHGIGFPKWTHARREYVQFWFKHFLGKDFVNE